MSPTPKPQVHVSSFQTVQPVPPSCWDVLCPSPHAPGKSVSPRGGPGSSSCRAAARPVAPRVSTASPHACLSPGVEGRWCKDSVIQRHIPVTGCPQPRTLQSPLCPSLVLRAPRCGYCIVLSGLRRGRLKLRGMMSLPQGHSRDKARGMTWVPSQPSPLVLASPSSTPHRPALLMVPVETSRGCPPACPGFMCPLPHPTHTPVLPQPRTHLLPAHKELGHHAAPGFWPASGTISMAQPSPAPRDPPAPGLTCTHRVLVHAPAASLPAGPHRG
jgi:hypothetical protein